MKHPSDVLHFSRGRSRHRVCDRPPSNPRAHLASNKLLAVLSATPSLARLRPHLSLVGLKRDEVLQDFGLPATHVYFPSSCMVSLSCIAPDGTHSELTGIGTEGMVGISAIMRSDAAGSWATVVSPGDAWLLPAEALQQEFAKDEACQSLLLRYLHTLLVDISHRSLCDAHHCLQQRLCRLLLEMLNRGATEDLHATQELMANRLGVRRESVNEAARVLQKDGVIRYRHGRVRVLDRARLAALSCECYELIQSEYERLFSNEVGRSAPRWDRGVSYRPQTKNSYNHTYNGI
jgi:CRP-like cAMP-binding protein